MLIVTFMFVTSLLAAIALSAKIYGRQNERACALEEALAAGQVELIQVRVITQAHERVRLGSSLETPPIISAVPRLETDDVLLEEVMVHRERQPRRFRLPAGKRLDIVHLPGAVREELRVETTATGVAHRFSFEVDAETTFWLSARVAPRGEPYRDDQACGLHPHDGGFQAAVSKHGLTSRPFGKGQAALVAVGLLALFSLAGATFRHGWLAGLMINVPLYFVLARSLLSPPAASPQMRIEGQRTAQRIEVPQLTEDELLAEAEAASSELTRRRHLQDDVRFVAFDQPNAVFQKEDESRRGESGG